MRGRGRRHTVASSTSSSPRSTSTSGWSWSDRRRWKLNRRHNFFWWDALTISRVPSTQNAYLS